MKKIAIILANEIDDVELFIPLFIWRKAKISIELISIEKKNSIMTESGVKVGCNSTFDIVNMTKYNAIYIPGGNGTNRFLNENWPTKSSNGIGWEKFAKIIRSYRFDKSKFILLTHKSSSILNYHNLIGDSLIAGYKDGYVLDENKLEEVVVSQNLITVIGYWQLTEFALQVIEKLLGEKIREDIESQFYPKEDIDQK